MRIFPAWPTGRARRLGRGLRSPKQGPALALGPARPGHCDQMAPAGHAFRSRWDRLARQPGSRRSYPARRRQVYPARVMPGRRPKPRVEMNTTRTAGKVSRRYVPAYLRSIRIRGIADLTPPRRPKGVAMTVTENGFPAKARRKIVQATAEGYRTAMRAFAEQPLLAVWYTHLDIEQALERVPVADEGEKVQGHRNACWPRRTPATARRRWTS